MAMRLRCILLALGLASLSTTATATESPACGCVALPNQTGLLWAGAEPELDLRALAELAAPMPWFSPDEPALAADFAPLPHPCDAPSSVPVVYYQLEQVLLRDDVHVTEPPDEDPALMS